MTSSISPGYSEASTALAAGDLLFFYTDGLVETENEQQEMFGAERLERILENVRTDSIDSILHAVEDRVTVFRGAAEPFDDATMMALRIS